MQKFIVALAFVGAVTACRTTNTSTTTMSAPGPSGNQTGAADAMTALRAFIGAANTTDLQAMSALFGDRDGTARDRLPRQELEMREILMARCLKNDRYDVIGDAPAPGGGRTFVVKLTKGAKSGSAGFDVVTGPDRRWYVHSFEIDKLSEYCKD